MCTLPLVDVLVKSAEKGCGPWKANAAEALRIIRRQSANAVEKRGFTILFSSKVIGARLLIHQIAPRQTMRSPASVYFLEDCRIPARFLRSCAGKAENNFTKSGDGALRERRLLLGEGNNLLIYRNLDDLFLNRVRHQLGLVVDVELAHQVELVRFHRLDAETQNDRDLLH